MGHQDLTSRFDQWVIIGEKNVTKWFSEANDNVNC